MGGNKTMRRRSLVGILIAAILTTVVVYLSLNLKEKNEKEIMKIESHSVEKSYEIPLKRDDYLGVLAVHNNKIIYYALTENNALSFSSYDIMTGEKNKIGSIPNFLINNDSSAIIGDSIYFFTTTGTTENYSVKLFEINLIKNRLTERSSENLYQSLAYIKATNNGVISLKGNLHKDIGETYIELFNSENNDSNIIVKKTLDVTTGKGEVIKSIAYSDLEIYAILNKTNENNEFYLNKYNGEGLELESVNIANLKGILENQNIDELKVMGDYVFIRNFSGAAVIGEIVDGHVSPIVSSEYGLDVALDSVGEGLNNYLFFEREGTNMFMLDMEKKELLKVKLNIDDEYSKFGYLVADEENNVLVSLKSEEGAQKMYYINVMEYIEVEH